MVQDGGKGENMQILEMYDGEKEPQESTSAPTYCVGRRRNKWFSLSVT